MNHSPLPWKAERTLIRAEGNVLIAAAEWADVDPLEAHDNAAYIVRACNNFEALLEACQAYLAHESQTFTGTPREKLEKYNQAMRQEGEVRRQIREAVAAATPEPEPKA